MSAILYVIGALGVLSLIGIPIMIVALKKSKGNGVVIPKGMALFVGIRASSRTPFLRVGKPERGIFHWIEKDDFEMDIPMDQEMTLQGEDKVVLVDLDAGIPITYLGDCHNDDYITVETTPGNFVDMSAAAFKDTYGADPSAGHAAIKAALKQRGARSYWQGLWRRLAGARNAKIRKDTRIKQMNDMDQTIWDALVKFVPLFMIFAGFFLFIVIILMIVVLVKVA